MKIVNKKEILRGKQIIDTLGMAKASLAITNYNVETNNINKRMFLYSDEKITLSTTGSVFFGKVHEDGYNFTFDPQQKLPWVYGQKEIGVRQNIKNMIRTILSDHKDVLKLSNAYKSLTLEFENVLAYVIKGGLLKGKYLPLSTQLKYNWALDPKLISVVAEPIEEEVALTKTETKSNKVEGVSIMKRIERNQVMSVAHNIRRRMEKEDKDFAADPYVVRMAYALVEAWELYKNQAAIQVQKEVAPDVVPPVIPVEPVTKEAAMAEHPKNVVEFKPKNEELIAKSDDGQKRIKGEYYLLAVPGIVTIEDYTGKVIKRFDISEFKIGNNTLGKLRVKFTEREFAKSNFYKNNASKLIVLASYPDEYSDRKVPKALVQIKK